MMTVHLWFLTRVINAACVNNTVRNALKTDPEFHPERYPHLLHLPSGLTIGATLSESELPGAKGHTDMCFSIAS